MIHLSFPFIVFISLILYSNGNFVASDLAQITETALSCNIPNCTECPNNMGGTVSCTRCLLGYFIYQIPQTFDVDQGYTSAQYICVQCPNYSQATLSYIPCGDCVDNPNTWAQTRQCTYYYTIDAPTAAARNMNTDVIMRQTSTQSSLFSIAIQKSGSTYSSSISECLGCLSFCGNTILEQGCNQYTSTTTTDTFQTAVICRETFYWDKNSCNNLCNTNGTCSKCKKVSFVATCMVCMDGYALDQNGNCIQCSSVITNCQKCFYGDTSGRNYSQDPQQFVGQPLPPNTQLRCTSCALTQSNQAGGSTLTTVQINVQMIPSLDLTQCQSCSSNCVRCDYSTTQNGMDVHSTNPKVIPAGQQSIYQQRCRVCSSGYVLNPSGTCETCNIANCSQCAYGTNGNPETYYTSNVNNFAIQDSQILTAGNYGSNTVFCAVCSKGYNRNSGGTCDQNVPAQCHSSIKGNCLICDDGMISSSGACSNPSQSFSTFTNCGQYYTATSGGSSNTYCLSCVQYDGGSNVSYGYPNYNTQACDNCDTTGMCSQCTQWNWRFNLVDYLSFQRPYLTSNQFSTYKDTLELESTAWCLQCTAPNLLDPWTGQCYGCLSTCDGCSSKFGLPNCSKCNLSSVTTVSGLTVKRSQNLSKIGCTLCSDYEQNCMEITTATKLMNNPFYTNSVEFGSTVRWTYANQCRGIASDVGSTVAYYSSRYMFYNSYNQKCQVCQTANGCKKSVTIPYFIDTVITTNQDISTYYAQTLFTGYSAYSLTYLTSQEVPTININLRDALYFNNAYIKFAEEGVEQITFQIIFVGAQLNANYISSASIYFNLSFLSEAMQMIPTLLTLKASVNTMISGNFNSIGQLKMKLYLQSQIVFDSFTNVEFNNIELYPIQNTDSNATKSPFFIILTNTLVPASVTFNNCLVGNTNSVTQQSGDYEDKGTSQYFSLVCPNMKSLTLNGFTLNQIYYPPQINFYDPGTQNLAFSFSLSNVAFTGLSFSYISLFGMNNTNSQISINTITISNTIFNNAYFIRELEGLAVSYLRFDINTATFSGLTMTDSFLIYVMNAVRFKASTWTFTGPFTALSSTKITSIICTNLISISGLTISSTQANTFLLDTASFFTTPSYSLLVQQNLQINHRYTQVTIDTIKCNLAANSYSLNVYTCFFNLFTPYNPPNFKLNVLMSQVTIQNTYTDQTKLQTTWTLVNIENVDSLEMDSFNLLRNQKFQGISVFDPSVFTVAGFTCGDPDTTNYSVNLPFTGLSTALDQTKLHGYCLSATYCQQSLSFSGIVLQNYSGYNQSPFQIICTKNVKNQQNTGMQVPLTINSYSITNSIIFQDNPNIQISPFLISNPYIFNIQINKIIVSVSQITPINGLANSNFHSSTVLLVDSIASSLIITNSKVVDTVCKFSQNAVAVTVQVFTVSNSIFRNGNQGLQASVVNTKGGFINAKAQTMNFADITLETAVADQGCGLYLVTLNPATINISGTSTFYDLQSSTNMLTQGVGGGIYIDSTQATLNLNINGATFKNIYTRTVGGAIYVNSGPNQATITIQNCLLQNVYSPSGSIIYSSQINSGSSITIQNNIIEWTDQSTIYSYLTTTLVSGTNAPDPLLYTALQSHTQIWISKGSLTTSNNIFLGLRYQTLFYLLQLSSWQDTGSTVDGYEMSTYPFIYTYKTTSIQFTNTVFSNISPFQHNSGIPFFNYVENTEYSVILHNQDVAITYTGVTIAKNRQYTPYGFVQFQQWSGLLTITGGVFNYNMGNKGVLFLSQSSTTSVSSRLLQEDESVDDSIECENSPIMEFKSSSPRMLSSTATTAVITNCNFNGNYAIEGAGINSYYTTVTMSGSTFTNNVASGVGGAFYSYQLSTSTNTITFAGNTFTNNIAGSGGAYQILGITPTLSTTTPNTFTTNAATYFGSTQVQSPVAIRLLYNGNIYNYAQGSTTIPSISFYGSGQSPGALIAQLVGSDGKVLRNQTDTLTVALNFATGDTIDSTAAISGNTVFAFNELIGGYNLTSIIFIVKPPNILKVKFYSAAVIIPVVNSVGTITSYDTSYVFPLIIHMRDCVQGEIYEPSTGQCYACPYTKYALIVGSETCLSCPKVGVDVCPGYNIMNITAGYWRANTSTDLIADCFNYPSNCVGGKQSQLCYEGHIGALCEECDLYGVQWGEAYALSGNYVCGKCSEISGNAEKVVIITIWTLISTLLSVKSSIQQVEQYIQSQILIVAGFALGGKSSNSKNQAGVLIKILTSYFQVISVLFTFNLTVPSFFSTTTSAVGNPSQQMSVSMDCFFLNMSSMPVVYFRLVWQLINPLLFIAAAIIAYALGVTLKKIRKNIGYIWCTCIFLFITLQPSVILAFISTGSCRTINQVQYVKANVSYICYTSEHIKYLISLVIPSLLFWVIIVPGLFFVKLHRSRDKIYSNIWIRYRYGYLYMEYAPRAYFWEFVKMFEKIMLIIIINIYDDDTKVKGVLCFLTVIVYLILSYIFKPYLENEQNRLDQRGNEACAISMIMGVFIYQNSYNYLIVIGYIVLLFVNVLFVLDIVRGLLRGYTKTLDDLINTQHEKIVKKLAKYPSIQKFFVAKHKSYVPLERINFLWRRTSKYVHKWFTLRKEDPDYKFFNVVLDPVKPKEERKYSEEEEIGQQDEEQLQLQDEKKQRSPILGNYDSATVQSSETRSPLFESKGLLNPNIVKIRNQSGKNNNNNNITNSPGQISQVDSIQEEIFNLEDVESNKPLNTRTINLSQQGNDTPTTRVRKQLGDDTPSRFKDTQTGSVKSYQQNRRSQLQQFNTPTNRQSQDNEEEDFNL